MMKRWVLAASMFLALWCVPAEGWAQHDIRTSGRIGLGLGGGPSPSGISVKYFLGSSAAVQATAGGFGRFGLGVGADLLLELPFLVQTDVVDIGWYLGAGAGLGLAEEAVYARVDGVVGAGLYLNILPIDFVLELRPRLNVLPLGAGISGGAHVRYYF